MCNCNSSFCAVCCRRVKAYRFDNVPEITGDLQLYTEFYKVGEAYGHWKFTIDDLEAYLDIPTVLWSDKLVAFGHTATGGLFYHTNFRFDYDTESLTFGTRGIGSEGFTSLSFGTGNIIEGAGSFAKGDLNIIDTDTSNGIVYGENNILIDSSTSIVFGAYNTLTSAAINFVVGLQNVSTGFGNNIIGQYTNATHDNNSVFSDGIGGSSTIADNAFTGQFAGGYRFRLDAASTAVNISSTGIVSIDNVVNNNTETQLLVWNVTTKEVEYREVSSLPGGGGGSGTVTSVDAAFLNGTALTVVGGAITTAGTFDFEWQGLNTDYVAGDGSIIAFPTLTSGTVTSVSAGNGMTFTTITTSGAVTLGTPSSITLASTNSVGVGTHSHLFAPGGTTAQYIRGDGTLATTPLGSVTSVGMTITAATALSVAGSPITTSGTFAVTWTGSNTQYVAGDGSLITFPTLTSGTVTAVNSGAGMDFTNFTTSGTIILGTPSTITLSSTNVATGTTHSHEFDLGGTAGQYLAGDNTLQPFPIIPTITPSALTKTDDTNVTLTLGGGHATALLQATSITAGWNGVLGVNRGGSGAATFSAGYLKANGTSAFTTVGTIPYSEISDAPSLYWIRDGASNRITLINNSDVVCLNTSFGFGMLNIGDVGYIPNTWQANLTILQTDTYGIDKGSSISFIPAAGGSFAGAGKFGFYKENATLYNQDTYFAISTRTGASNVTVDSIKLQISGAGLVNITNIPTGSSSNNILTSNGGTIEQRLVSSLPFTNNIGTVTNFSAHDLTTGYAYPLFTVNVTNPTTIPDLTFSLPSLPQKFVFAAPWGVTGTPLWRQLLPSDLSQDGATSGQVITWNGSSWVPQNAAGGGVTSVSAGNGMNFTTITTTGAVTMGAPQNVTLSSTSGFPSSTTHSHAFVPGGTSAQYIRGDGVLATLPTYTSGAGISVVSGVITNTLPSKWQIIGALYLTPSVSAYDIATPITGSIGYVTMTKGTASQCGYFEVRTAAAARVGYIGYQTGYMNYSSDIGNHRFNGGTVQINNIPTGSTSVNLLTTNGGVVETRTIASLTGLPSSVWNIQGGTTPATSATSQDIYHIGKMKIGFSTTSSISAYDLNVTGNNGIASNRNLEFQSLLYGVSGVDSGVTIRNMIRQIAGSLIEIGNNVNDIYLPGYTSARSADTKVSTDKYMYVNASGLVKLDSDQNIRNVIGWISKTTNTGVTAGGGPTKISGSTVQQTAGGPYTTVSGNLTIPAQDRYHLITVTVQFVTTSGVAATPNITFDVYNGSGVVQDSAYIVNHDVINDTKEYSFVLQGTTAGVTSIYVRATATVAGITVQKCHMKAMDMGPV